MNGVKEILEADFTSEVIKSNLPVLVDFFAPWCGPCRALAPALEDIAKKYDGKLKIVKINVDDAQQLAGKYGIQSVPTLMSFKDGKTVDTIVGLTSLSALRARLDAVIAAPSRVGVCGCCA